MLQAFLNHTSPSHADLLTEAYYILSLQELPPYSSTYRRWLNQSMQDFVDHLPPLHNSPIWFLLGALRRASRRLMRPDRVLAASLPGDVQVGQRPAETGSQERRVLPTRPPSLADAPSHEQPPLPPLPPPLQWTPDHELCRQVVRALAQALELTVYSLCEHEASFVLWMATGLVHRQLPESTFDEEYLPALVAVLIHTWNADFLAPLQKEMLLHTVVALSTGQARSAAVRRSRSRHAAGAADQPRTPQTGFYASPTAGFPRVPLARTTQPVDGRAAASFDPSQSSYFGTARAGQPPQPPVPPPPEPGAAATPADQFMGEIRARFGSHYGRFDLLQAVACIVTLRPTGSAPSLAAPSPSPAAPSRPAAAAAAAAAAPGRGAAEGHELTGEPVRPPPAVRRGPRDSSTQRRETVLAGSEARPGGGGGAPPRQLQQTTRPEPAPTGGPGPSQPSLVRGRPLSSQDLAPGAGRALGGAPDRASERRSSSSPSETHVATLVLSESWTRHILMRYIVNTGRRVGDIAEFWGRRPIEVYSAMQDGVRSTADYGERASYAEAALAILWQLPLPDIAEYLWGMNRLGSDEAMQIRQYLTSQFYQASNPADGGDDLGPVLQRLALLQAARGEEDEGGEEKDSDEGGRGDGSAGGRGNGDGDRDGDGGGGGGGGGDANRGGDGDGGGDGDDSRGGRWDGSEEGGETRSCESPLERNLWERLPAYQHTETLTALFSQSDFCEAAYRAVLAAYDHHLPEVMIVDGLVVRLAQLPDGSISFAARVILVRLCGEMQESLGGEDSTQVYVALRQRTKEMVRVWAFGTHQEQRWAIDRDVREAWRGQSVPGPDAFLWEWA